MSDFLYVHEAWIHGSGIMILLAVAAYLTLHVGLFALSQVGFAAMGAYAAAILTVDHGVHPLVAAILAIVACVATGTLLGLGILHLRGVYLALATISFSQFVALVIQSSTSITGGASGIAGISRHVGSGEIWGALALVVAGCAIVSRTSVGRQAVALREGRETARMAGVPARRIELRYFVASAAVAGLAGVLEAYSSYAVSPSSYSFAKMVTMMSVVIVGGVATWLGPLVGGAILLPFAEFVESDPNLHQALYGLVLVVVAVLAPRGVVGTAAQLVRQAARHRGSPTKPATSVEAASAVPGPHAAVGIERKAGLRADGPPLLAARGLSRQYGGVRAVDDVDLEIGAGELVGLIGANGAGKTTLLNLLSGVARPTAGTISVNGVQLGGRPPEVFVANGVGRTFQLAQAFSELSIEQNLELAVRRRAKLGRPTPPWLEGEDEVGALLRAVGLGGLDRRARGAGQPYGVVRRLELARIMALAPSVVLLDEPLAGLAIEEAPAIGEYVDLLAASGAAVLLVDHDMSFVFDHVQRVVVLELGRVLASGSPDEVRSDEVVKRAYLGTSTAEEVLDAP